ncbi:GlxA family transcriptional regulator [Salininema proteolyticum]|uniref:GlxA family transcriptional regulator n=1 Tax=Salininema proteolyticum TaxID=1607685 RepID=A0ABV8TXD6_9ACTN
MPTVAFLLAPRVHLLDLAGPAQVFSTAADLGLGYTIRYTAEEDTVTTPQGVALRAETEWPDLTVGDLALVPGWRSPADRPVRTALSPRATAPLAEHHARGGTVGSVCSGAFALGQAGLLNGRSCTTHHELQERLQRRFPRARVVPDVLYTDDDRVVTSAGIASGIDLALYLLTQRHGPAWSARVARSMVVYARRNGDALQESALLRHRNHVSEVVHRVQDEIDRRFGETLPLKELADGAHVSERTLTRRFERATGLTPLRYQQSLRVERAEQLIAAGSTVEAAAREVGFADARMLRNLRGRPVRLRLSAVLAMGP